MAHADTNQISTTNYFENILLKQLPREGWQPRPNLVHGWGILILTSDDQLAQLAEHRTTVREVPGSNPGRTNTQGH